MPRSSVVIGLAVALISLAACSDEPDEGDSAPKDTASVARGTLTRATLDLGGGADEVVVDGSAPADRLVRVETEDAERPPKADADDDRARVSVSGGTALVHLAPDVTWSLDLGAGASRLEVHLPEQGVAGVTLSEGASSVQLDLGRPDGTVRVEQAAGSSLLALHLPQGVAARVTVTAGAGQVAVDGRTSHGVGPGTVRTTRGFDAASPHYEVRVGAGASRVVVDHPE